MATVVLYHALDEGAGVYRMTFGQELTRTWIDEVPSDDDGEMVAVERVETIITDIEEVVWVAADKRWFDEHGQRRPHEDVAAEQRDIVRAGLDQRARDAEQAPQPEEPQPLPGAGEAL